MKALHYIFAIALCALLMGCKREQMASDDWGREDLPEDGMRFGVDLSSTKSVFDGETLQLKWRGDETITVLSCPVAMLDIWGNSDVQSGDFSKIHFGNYGISVDSANPAVGTVIARGAVSDWVGGETGEGTDQYAFMAWTPSFSLIPGQGEGDSGFYTQVEVPETQLDADYSKYQILYSTDLHMPTDEDPNDYVYSREAILGGAQVNFASFEPATSIIRFRMKTADEAMHSVSKIIIQSESGAPLTGKAGLQPDGTGVSPWSHFWPTQTDQNSSRIVIPFSNSINVGATSGDWYYAVVIPCEATGKITFTAFDEDDKEILYADKDAPEGGFETGCRYNVDLTMEVPPTEFFYVPSGDVVLPAGETEAVITVASYHLDLATGAKTTLPFSYEGAYLDPECTVALPDNAPRRYYHGFMVHADDQNLSIVPLPDGQVQVTVPVEENLNDVVLASDYAGATATLRAREEVGSSTAPVDLAAGNTANTYVVTAPGWYSLPLVYGNAIKGGIDNPAAYNAFSSETGIVSPNITGASSAYVIWTDAYVPFDATVTREEVIDYGNSRTIESDLSLQISGNRLVFHLPKEGIDQGNLVIGVKNASGTTLWSWQIWVRDTPLGSDELTVGSSSFMQCPLGCSRPAMAEVITTEGVMYVKWKQAETNKEFVVKTTQQGHSAPFYRRYSPTSVNYQWGRKDPFYYYNSSGSEGTNAPKLISGAASSGYTGSGFMYEWNSDYNPSMAAAAPVSYVQGIANPYTSYGNYSELTWYTEDAALWSESVKTIFDPSPAGYRIPTEAEMSQLSETYRSISSIMVGGYEYSYLIRQMASGNIFNPSRTGMYIDNGTFHVTSWRPGFFWTNSSSGSIPKECDLGSFPVDSYNYRNLILPVRE